MKTKHIGFTLAELIVAIIIVAVVAAILFPVFAKAHHDRRRSHYSCASNIKQLGLGLIQYSEDYDNKWPDMGSGGGYWASQVYPYMKLTSVYWCPDDSTEPTSAPAYPISYAANSNLGFGGGGHLLTALSAPASTVLLSDFDSGTVTNFPYFCNGAPSNSNGRGYYGNCNLGAPCAGPTIHDPYIMFLTCDGHAKLIRPEQVSSGTDNPSPSAKQDATHAAGTKAVGGAMAYTLTLSEK